MPDRPVLAPESPSSLVLPDTLSVPPPSPPRFQILALSGGGYRGLFSARLLELIEAGGSPLAGCVDLFAGTSIGSLVAGALAVGVDAGTVRRSMEEHGPAIFPPRRWAARRLPDALYGLFAAPYGAAPLEATIDAILGERATLKLSEIPRALLIPCVSHTRAGVRLLRSAGLAGRAADDVTLKAAMLASAAAPTYFPPRRVGGEVLVDGGLVANAPETTAVCEAIADGRRPIERLHVLGIGTASASEARPPSDYGRPGKLHWAARALVRVAMAAQEDLATRQCRALLDDRYVRLDMRPSAHQSRAIALDRADAAASATLIDLADACHAALAQGDDGARVRRFLQHRAGGA